MGRVSLWALEGGGDSVNIAEWRGREVGHT